MSASLGTRVAMVAIGLSVAGCFATESANVSSVPELREGFRAHPYSVRVERAAAQAPDWWNATTTLSDETYSTAAYQSLVKSGVFRAVLRQGDADFVLDVFGVALSQPFSLADVTVRVSSTWRLTHVASKRVVFDRTIASSHTATLSDTFFGFERVRLAHEGAVNANIAEGIRQLSRIDLTGVAVSGEVTE